MTWWWLVACGDPAVTEGHTAFAEGRVEDAVATWDAAAGEEPSGVLAYDLGTAYHRMGQLPRSIAWLRAAERVRPRDGNVHHNLALARADLGTGIPEPVELPAGWMAVATPGELGLLGLLVTVVGSACAAAARWRPARFGTLRGLAALLLAAGVVGGGVGAWGAAAAIDHPVAVVAQAEVPVRDAATVDAGERFVLPAGTEVQVERSNGAFLLVEDGRGRRGWIPVNAVVVGWGPLRAVSPAPPHSGAPPG
jgi:hypothetical protein